MSKSVWIKFGLLARGVAVVGSLVALATGVSFAALQSPAASLTNNTIQSATADLRIGTSATSFASSRAGFDFTGIVPGGNAQPATGHAFWLKNYGTAAMGVRLAISSTPINSSSVELGQVWIVISRQDTGATQSLSLQTLVEAYPNGIALADGIDPGAVVEYRMQAKMDEQAFNGSEALIGDIDLVFSGTAVVN